MRLVAVDPHDLTAVTASVELLNAAQLVDDPDEHPAPRDGPCRTTARITTDDEHGAVAELGVEGSSSGHRVTVTRARADPGRDGRPVAIPPRASRRSPGRVYRPMLDMSG